jgi:membrane fusion protein (multidrug efflux system)
MAQLQTTSGAALLQDDEARPQDTSEPPIARTEPEADHVAAEPQQPANPVKKIVTAILVALLLIAGVLKGIDVYRFGQTHVDTDDAYVTGDLVNISPIISGTLAKLTVEEGDVVKKGQLIARLDDSGPRATLQQARAELDAALSQIPQAERTLAYTEQATDATIQHARAAILAQDARTNGAQQQVVLSAETLRNQVHQAESQVMQAKAQAAQAEAQAAQSEAEVKTAEAGVASYRQAIQTAERAANASVAGIEAANANEERATKDESRYALLVKQEAVTPQQYDTAHAAATSSRAQLTSAIEQAAEARSRVEQARANLDQAQAQREAAKRQAIAAHKQAEAAQQQVQVALAGLGLAKANSNRVNIDRSNVLNNRQQISQAQADLMNALAGNEQIAVRRKQIDTYRAQVQQARAAVKNAQVTLDDTCIYAPCSGVVVKKPTNVGAALSPGQTIVTVTQGDRVWVSANFKETQLTHVRSGQPVEVEVDSFPGKIFAGTVASVNRATGAATTVLPPDNATGNFTKVVQRIPVKIYFEASRAGGKYASDKDIAALRQGMSVTATIDTAMNTAKDTANNTAGGGK